tara:strand:+ start:8067 stop:8957 length:891 start_codon:yes stop_codon:yes gene_type:complete
MMKKTLVIGASGSFGKELIKFYNPKKIICTYYKNPINKGIKFNAISDKIENIINKFDGISEGILLFAEKNPNTCFQNKKYSNKLNVLAIKKIIKVFKKFNIKPIFLSTDLVFSGKKGNYSEKSNPNPKTLYGKQKYSVEKIITKNFKNYLIFRLSKTYCFKDKKDSFLNWVNFLENNEEILCAKDQIYNPIYLKDAAKVVYNISKKKSNGVFNVAGPKSYSRYEIFKKLNKEYFQFQKRKVNLIICKFNDLNKNYEKWPLNTSMNMTKLNKALNINYMSLNKALNHTVKIYFKTKV